MPTPMRVLLLLLSLLMIHSLTVSAAQEGIAIDRDALLHDSRDDLYRSPFGAVPFGTPVTLRLRAAAGNLDAVTVRLYRTVDRSQALLPMQRVATTPDGYDLWETTVETGRRTTVLYYRFLLTRNSETLYYEDDTRPNGFDYIESAKGGVGTVYEQSPDLSFQISVYDPGFYTPEWMRNAIVYQIFPDRFRNGDSTNDPQDGSDVFYGELPLLFHEVWNEPPVNGRVTQAPGGAGYFNSDFYGGDLAGITGQLDYLQALGVTAIYLNPIFEARSNHRYDASDYTQIDPILGDIESFRALVDEASQRGMQIILDGVLNHMSSDSAFFDRYHRFPVDGACESLTSPYRDMFLFVPPNAQQPSPCVNTPDGATYYVSWAGFDSIPKINSGLIDVRRFLYLDQGSMTRQWLREGIGGWRLDVANEIDDGVNPGELFWETYRAVVRSENPEAVIIGEFWGDASEWLLGDEWDSTMNYRFRRAIVGLVRDTDFVDNDGRIVALAPSGFDSAIQAVAEDYPPMAYHAMMNLVDSHDTTRLLFSVDNDPALHRLAALTQFTLPGAPTVYYGDEIALQADSVPDDSGVFQDDPFNRAPYPWPDTDGDYYPPPDEAMLAFYQGLGALRHANPALREGAMTTLVADDSTGVFAFLRTDATTGNLAVVVLNSGDAQADLRLDLAGVVPRGVDLIPFAGADPLSTDPGSLTVRVPGRSGEVWSGWASAEAFAPVAATGNLQTVGGSGLVAVAWDSVPGAAGYQVYRSPVPVGGFEPVGAVVTGTVFIDRDVANGFPYYYAVASSSPSGIIGPLSTSAQAIPSTDIDAAFYAGDEGQPLVESVQRRLELVAGLAVEFNAGVQVGGLTDQDGRAVGLLAEAALVAGGSAASDVEWQPMSYAFDAGGADIYRASLSPQATGSFTLQARFSADAGETWTAVTLPDGDSLPLLVTASSDTEAPAPPPSVDVVRASVSGVVLTWAESTAGDLATYRVYRVDVDGESRLIGEIPAGDEPRFRDANVVAGDNVRYAVTAVDTSLNESAMTATGAVSVAQSLVPVTFVAEVPAGTEGDVYIAGSFGTGDYPTWDPGGLVMEPVDGTHWTITLDIPEGAAIEYKFVRGTWERVEKGSECEEIANRRLAVLLDETNSLTAEHVVATWRDTCGG